MGREHETRCDTSPLYHSATRIQGRPNSQILHGAKSVKLNLFASAPEIPLTRSFLSTTLLVAVLRTSLECF